MNITKGLIIAEPWIGYILNGEKTWEMRASSSSHRGWFGLIRKGTGAVWGIAKLTEIGHALTPDEMVENFDKHRIPKEMIRSGEVAKWNTPWKLTDVTSLKAPVLYEHKNGAVTWVELSPDVSEAIKTQIDGRAITTHVVPNIQAVQPDRQPESVPSNGSFIGQVELTEGNIKNNHIYLRSFLEKFPADAIGGPNKSEKAEQVVTVDWGSHTPVQTDLDGSKKFFRARGWIKQFFENNTAAAGDRVVVEETTPYRYRVRLNKCVGIQK